MNPESKSPCPASVSCASLAAAREIRRRFSDCCIPRDDARETTVWYSDDAPTDAKETIGQIAHQSHQQAEAGCGQAELSESERQRIDFSRTNVFHARACKAISIECVVDDWLARYDHTLTVTEHVDIYRRAGCTRGSGMRESLTLREITPRRIA